MTCKPDDVGDSDCSFLFFKIIILTVMTLRTDRKAAYQIKECQLVYFFLTLLSSC